jgi:hypothetical protein
LPQHMTMLVEQLRLRRPYLLNAKSETAVN